VVNQLFAGRDERAARRKILKVRNVNCVEASHGVLQTGSSESFSTSFIPPCAGRVKGAHHDDQQNLWATFLKSRKTEPKPDIKFVLARTKLSKPTSAGVSILEHSPPDRKSPGSTFMLGFSVLFGQCFGGIAHSRLLRFYYVSVFLLALQA
jgi:hypothetical protein